MRTVEERAVQIHTVAEALVVVFWIVFLVALVLKVVKDCQRGKNNNGEDDGTAR
jgi:hypothetical protein